MSDNEQRDDHRQGEAQQQGTGRKLPSVLDRFAGRDVDMAELEESMSQDYQRHALAAMDRAAAKRRAARQADQTPPKASGGDAAEGKATGG